jgi:pimeloyl-ACP methyl ester carboxylesterase
MKKAREKDLIDHSHRPSKLLLLLEGRAVYDAAAMVPMLGLKRFLPRGDNHPVLVFPGFLASSRSTQPLRKYLAGLGYRAHRWKLGYNMGYSFKLHYGMRDRVTELVDRYGEKISLVGWSLGGVYARELAREMPDIVRQVVSMGSPFRGHPSSSNIHKIFNMFSEVPYDEMPETFLQHMAHPPPVPTTVALADRLAQPEGRWRPFKPSFWMKPLFHNWYPDWLVHGEENPIRVASILD